MADRFGRERPEPEDIVSVFVLDFVFVDFVCVFVFFVDIVRVFVLDFVLVEVTSTSPIL